MKTQGLVPLRKAAGITKVGCTC